MGSQLILPFYMKDATHPTYHPAVKIACACGADFTAGSTSEAIRVELCSSCHPFYTGKQKFVDTARRVEKFQEKAARSATTTQTHASKKAKHAARATKKSASEA